MRCDFRIGCVAWVLIVTAISSGLRTAPQIAQASCFLFFLPVTNPLTDLQGMGLASPVNHPSEVFCPVLCTLASLYVYQAPLPIIKNDRGTFHDCAANSRTLPYRYRPGESEAPTNSYEYTGYLSMAFVSGFPACLLRPTLLFMNKDSFIPSALDGPPFSRLIPKFVACNRRLEFPQQLRIPSAVAIATSRLLENSADRFSP